MDVLNKHSYICLFQVRICEMKDLGEENSAQELNETGHIISFSDGSENEGETHDQCVEFSSLTPVKTKEPTRVKCQEAPVEDLPEK